MFGSSPTYSPYGIGAPPNSLERLGATVSHASLVLGIPFLGPLCVMVLGKILVPDSTYVQEQSVQALLFHLLTTVVLAVVGGLAYVMWMIILIGWPVALVLSIFWVCFALWAWIIALIATIKAIQGLPYQMPLVGGRRF